ncbi:hypothetical protein QAC21B_00581 [Acinetobacter bohemicus]|nr:hypothetical protein QAC21B_00581 [Acinetobacter bohemicus]
MISNTSSRTSRSVKSATQIPPNQPCDGYGYYLYFHPKLTKYLNSSSYYSYTYKSAIKEHDAFKPINKNKLLNFTIIEIV